MASFNLYATNLLCLKLSDFIVSLIIKFCFMPKYSSQFIFFAFSYTSSASVALNCAIGTNILIALRRFKFALYNRALSPLNLTALLSVSISLAPNSVNSRANISSRPK